MKKIRFITVCMLFAIVFWHAPVHAQNEPPTEDSPEASTEAESIESGTGALETETESNAFDESLEEFPGFKKFYKNSQVTVVPIPVFATQPDEGQTYGVMPTILITNKSGSRMKTIISPQIAYNTLTRVMGTAAILVYPSKNSTLSVFGGAAERFYQEYEVIYSDQKAFNGDFYINVASRFYRNPFGRFFGLGPTSTKASKAYFTANTYLAETTIGYNILPQLRVSSIEHFYYQSLRNPLPGKNPDIITAFGNSNDVANGRNLTNSVALSYNSNRFNSTAIPFSKTEASGAFLFSNKKLGSDFNFTGTDWMVKQTLSYGPKRWFSTIIRFHYRQVFGSTLPFFELPSLGGANELRGYTAGRFVDKGMGILQIEQRNHIAHIDFFHRAAGDLYIDPFFEVGQVFHETSDFAWNNLQPVGGLGFRFYIPPGMLARVDVGFSREENFQVFTVLNYPF
ncbi:MAG: hypothetical protein COV45_03310 [Deltaproteobacteria bacterium CG11_big_fil_rev_8_21_14_0_20_47_16]|nr:MAG: hypothetical protein COV45_03310 [Deltaproteobacteria bacterium CG11_big_fil_rev_8_21_14_0_20_47_16]